MERRCRPGAARLVLVPVFVAELGLVADGGAAAASLGADPLRALAGYRDRPAL
jgi:hypothetical protein